MKILVVDNYDSFTYNLVQYLQQLQAHVTVWRNDDPQLWASDQDEAYNVARIADSSAMFDGILLSPGPGTPDRAGATCAVVHHSLLTGKPLLGVCLGHQAIGHVCGAVVERAPELFHGKVSQIIHQGEGVLTGMPEKFQATRYHSLTVREESLPKTLKAVGHSESGILMALMHRELPIHGVQFHPESILTQEGHRILANWMTLAGYAPPVGLLDSLVIDELPGLGFKNHALSYSPNS